MPLKDSIGSSCLVLSNSLQIAPMVVAAARNCPNQVKPVRMSQICMKKVDELRMQRNVLVAKTEPVMAMRNQNVQKMIERV